MARMKLNNTAAIAGRPLEAGECRTVESKKIDNGYLITDRYYNYGTGESRCHERFSKEPPRLNSGSATSEGEDATGSKGLADTMAYMSK